MIEAGFEQTVDKDIVIGKTDYDFFPKDVADEYRKNDIEVMETGRMITHEEKVSLPHGGSLTQMSVKRPLYDDNKQVIGVVGNTVDITAEKEAELLKRQVKVEQEKTQLMTSLLGSIAHELRTPLSTVELSIDVLADDVGGLVSSDEGKRLVPEVVQANFEELPVKMKRSILSCFLIIDMLLMNTREGSIPASDLKLLSIKQVVNDALSEYPLLADDKSILHVSLESDFHFKGNLLLTKHILFNLLKNAFYFVRAKGSGEIWITLRPGNEYNVLVFRDSGTGISQDLLPKIFDRFSSKRDKGTGLGLYYCKWVMTSYGGDITCQSKEGEYTEFHLCFPAV